MSIWDLFWILVFEIFSSYEREFFGFEEEEEEEMKKKERETTEVVGGGGGGF